MSDFKNPFDPDNFTLGVGWDGKTVTVTKSQFVTDLFGADDNPWIDPNTGERGFANVWAVTGISEDSDAERTEKYSIGKSLIPTNGGDSFEHQSGKPGATFNANAKAAKFASALKESGFDLSKLVDGEGRPSAAGLVGAIFVFRGETVLDKDGKPKEDKNGYRKYEFYPDKFVGFAKGSAPTVENSAVRNRAYDLITELLTEAEGNKLTRVQVIQGINKALKGDPELNDVVAMAIREDFNSTAPWKVEGTTISLS